MSAKVYYLDRKTGSINPHRHGHADGATFDRLMSPPADAAPYHSAQSTNAERDARDAAALDAQPVAEHAAGYRARDVAGDGVQAWSKGAIYPCIIGVIERYSIGGQLQSTSYELTYQGHAEEYATWSDAEMVAHALITGALNPVHWKAQS